MSDPNSLDATFRFSVKVHDVVEGCELWNAGYRSEVFIADSGVIAYKETPQELANRWNREGGWPGVREQP
jgi:hypothetical protein